MSKAGHVPRSDESSIVMNDSLRPGSYILLTKHGPGFSPEENYANFLIQQKGTTEKKGGSGNRVDGAQTANMNRNRAKQRKSRAKPESEERRLAKLATHRGRTNPAIQARKVDTSLAEEPLWPTEVILQYPDNTPHSDYARRKMAEADPLGVTSLFR